MRRGPSTLSDFGGMKSYEQRHAPVMRTRARIAVHDGRETCRVDVARSSQPVWAKTSKDDRVFFVRMNNSTRALPEAELPSYVTDRWSER